MFQDRQVHTSEINFLILNPEFLLFCEAGTDEISPILSASNPSFPGSYISHNASWYHLLVMCFCFFFTFEHSAADSIRGKSFTDRYKLLFW